MAHLFNLSGQTALVTGAAGGIGQAMALALTEAGADIILIVRNTAQRETHDAILKHGRQCWIFACDLGIGEAVSEVINNILRSHKFEILVNAAGIQRRADAAEYTQELYNEVMQVNVNSPFAISREVGKKWIADGTPGRIINVASLASYQGGVRMAGYSVSKGGVAMLTKALSNEWAKHGIRVNGIAPGYISTNMNVDVRTNADSALFDSISQRIPSGRWGDPKDFQAAIIFLASKPATAYLTGEIIAIDGGWLAR
ncbi:hypothetical protein M409DRAFT_23867 [Zasmidium cellare ATCC 36951]|uniref:Ketoreductase domain-containing protein n=1 Tax=Zasmidium cellare ATCC 36951 TaxID=1080233 RepID=A0A6A6CET1_ZASCE|nr:uncharacterized protein M409DRAFT_23867 [Zasmidium cellare ATCC 36951]KAF2165571.1 hypothetical protein M409DRAFT_23867 [Zasmidium cellare ATCC 36951]